MPDPVSTPLPALQPTSRLLPGLVLPESNHRSLGIASITLVATYILWIPLQIYTGE